MTPEQLLARAPTLARHSLLGLARPRRRPKTPLKPLSEPRAEMLRYTAVLRQLVAETKALVRAELVPRLPALVAEAGRFTSERTDDVGDTVAQIVEAIRQALGLSEVKARRWAMEMLERVQRTHAQKFVDAYEGRLAVNPLAGAEPWVRDQMAVAVKENARLITSLPDQMLAQVEGVVNRGVLAGKRHEDLAKLIAERFEVADSRAKLIARDQVLKWHGSLTRLRQVDAGVTEYEWSTSRDERVRPSHRARDGKQFKWTQAPKPGEEVNCRCAAIPVLSEEEEATKPVVKPKPRPLPAPKPRAPTPAEKVTRTRALEKAAEQVPAPVPVRPPAPAVAPPTSTRAVKVPKNGKRFPGAAEEATELGVLAGEAHAAEKMTPALARYVTELQDKVAEKFGIPVRKRVASVAKLDQAQEDVAEATFNNRTHKIALRLAAHKRPPPLQTVVHELIHSFGGAVRADGESLYLGKLAALEEAATEELAQAYVGGARLVIRAPKPVNHRDLDAAKKFMVRGKDELGEWYQGGAYLKWRNKLYDAVAAASGRSDDADALQHRVLTAMARWKQNTHETRNAAMDAFIEHLDPTDDERAFLKEVFHNEIWWGEAE